MFGKKVERTIYLVANSKEENYFIDKILTHCKDVVVSEARVVSEGVEYDPYKISNRDWIRNRIRLIPILK